jgi:hypothetical protein
MTFDEISSGNKNPDSVDRLEFPEMSPGAKNLDFSEFKHHFRGGESTKPSPKGTKPIESGYHHLELGNISQAPAESLQNRPVKERRSRASRATQKKPEN